MVIVLAHAADEGAASTEVLNRIRGELLADGYHVLLVDAVPKAERASSLSRTGRATGAAVAAGLFVGEGAGSVDLCLVDAVTGRVWTRSLDALPHSADQPPEVLARRTVDLLRANLVDFLVESLRSATQREPTKAPPSVEASDHPVEPSWVLEGGLGVLGSFQGLGPALLPLLRVRRSLGRAMSVRVTGAWLGTQPQVDAPTGTASVEQGVVLLECVAQFWRGAPVRPLFSLGAGTYYVGVNGSGVSPYPGVRSSEFAFALDAGSGVSTRIASQVDLVFELHALVAAPGLSVRFLDVDEARIGRPSLFGTFTIAGSL